MSLGMQFLVIGWLVLEVTDDKTQLGLTVFLYGLPNVGLLMVGGILADRLNRKLLLMVTQSLVGAVIAGLAVLTITDQVSLWHIYLSTALLGVLQALNMPARLAMLADLVGEQRLLDAVAQFNAAMHAGRIIGPPMAGILIDQWGIGVVLLLNASCYGASVLLLTMVRWTRHGPVPERQPLLRNIGEGLSVIRDTPMLLTVLVVTCIFGGFGMAHLQVIPAFAKDMLDSSASDVGLLLLASGIGALIGSLTLTFMHRAWLYRWLLFSIVTFTVLLTLFAWSGALNDLTGSDWSGWFWVTWGVHTAGGCGGHWLGVAVGYYDNAAVVATGSAWQGFGHPPLRPRLPPTGSLAPYPCGSRDRLATGDYQCGRSLPAGNIVLRSGAQKRSGFGRSPGVCVMSQGLLILPLP